MRHPQAPPAGSSATGQRRLACAPVAGQRAFKPAGQGCTQRAPPDADPPVPTQPSNPPLPAQRSALPPLTPPELLCHDRQRALRHVVGGVHAGVGGRDDGHQVRAVPRVLARVPAACSRVRLGFVGLGRRWRPDVQTRVWRCTVQCGAGCSGAGRRNAPHGHGQGGVPLDGAQHDGGGPRPLPVHLHAWSMRAVAAGWRWQLWRMPCRRAGTAAAQHRPGSSAAERPNHPTPPHAAARLEEAGAEEGGRAARVQLTDVRHQNRPVHATQVSAPGCRCHGRRSGRRAGRWVLGTHARPPAWPMQLLPCPAAPLQTSTACQATSKGPSRAHPVTLLYTPRRSAHSFRQRSVVRKCSTEGTSLAGGRVGGWREGRRG